MREINISSLLHVGNHMILPRYFLYLLFNLLTILFRYTPLIYPPIPSTISVWLTPWSLKEGATSWPSLVTVQMTEMMLKFPVFTLFLAQLLERTLG